MDKSPDKKTTLRFVIIACIVLAMLIPLTLVDGVTSERQQYFDDTFQDIAQAWGRAQAISGPFLIIPEIYRYQVRDENKQLIWREIIRERVLLPEALQIEAEIDHQFRHRAIYKVPVYQATLKFSGHFAPLSAKFRQRKNTQLQYQDAYLVIGISDTQAIGRASALNLNSDAFEFNSGTRQTWIGTGINAAVTGLSEKGLHKFSFNLQVKGTRELAITPLGNTTQINMQSSWPHPSFKGNYLPSHYDISKEGFSAQWDVHKLARNLPDTWRVDKQETNLHNSYAKIGLFQPITDYKTIDRAIKYGLLFIALTFLAFLCFELSTRQRFHSVQYGVVGASLVMFYMVLLALSEHIAFGLSYSIATALLSLLITAYVWAMTKSRNLSIWIAIIVGGLYSTLYVLLQLESYALLIGTLVLLLGLIALMFNTRSLTNTIITPD